MTAGSRLVARFHRARFAQRNSKWRLMSLQRDAHSGSRDQRKDGYL
ncbi:hypothetical protein KZO37_16035 [Rhodococcus fascians]|nr:hypothetical protein [Rhodococcus fascians]MBW4780877.1 hypothetical protein [Rhodococcus fascians]